MTDARGRVPLEEVCVNISEEFWATRGLEYGVQEQTEDAMDIIREVAADLPYMEGVAIVPVGSRVKGYARLDSDFDVAIVCYDEEAVPFRTRMALGESITKRLGVKVCGPIFPSVADEVLTISLIDYGHAASFSPQDLPFALTPTAFEGERVAKLRQRVLEQWLGKSKVHLEYAERAYTRSLIDSRFSSDGVATRYRAIVNAAETDRPDYREVEDSFRSAYERRLQNFGGNILAKINDKISQS